MPGAIAPMSPPGRRRCLRIRVTNGVTDRSKNLRLSDDDLDDSILEKIYENPSTKEVLKWPKEQDEQIQKNTLKVRCVLKRENKEDIIFSEDEMGKTNIHDLMELQKEGNGGDLIQLVLECSIYEQNKAQDDNSEIDAVLSPSAVPLTGVNRMTMRSRIFNDHPLSPSILRTNPASKKRRKKVSFLERSLEVPALEDDGMEVEATTN